MAIQRKAKPTSPEDVLKSFWQKWGAQEKSNIAKHLRAGVKPLCGKDYLEWMTDMDIDIAVMATHSTIPRLNPKLKGWVPMSLVRQWGLSLEKILKSPKDHTTYLKALSRLDEGQVIQILKELVKESNIGKESDRKSPRGYKGQEADKEV